MLKVAFAKDKCGSKKLEAKMWMVSITLSREMGSDLSLLKKWITPLHQFAVALIVGLTGMLFCRLFHAGKGSEYFAALFAIILFTMFNTVASLAYSSFLRYTIPSFYIYILLVIVLFLSAKLFSGISIWHLSIYRNMLLSISIFFAIISVVVRIFRLVYEAAEKGI